MDKTIFSTDDIQAHRGASATHPENTLPAFYAAVTAGTESMECDVSILADGTLCAFHDAKLGRTAHADDPALAGAAIASLTADDLCRIDAGGWKHPDFRGERIPLLDDILALQRETDMPFNWEIKTHDIPGAAARMIDALRRAMTSRENISLSILSSFERAVLAEAKAQSDALPLPRALVARALPDDWREAVAECGCSAIHLDVRQIRTSDIPVIKEAGLDLRVYTVNDAADAARLLEAGVDEIITDRVEEFLGVKNPPRISVHPARDGA